MKFSDNDLRELRLPGRELERPGQNFKDFRFTFWKSSQNSSQLRKNHTFLRDEAMCVCVFVGV